MSEYRKQIDTTEELAHWYNAKYVEMGDGWNTPADECNQHLDRLGVPFDKNKTLLDVGCGAGHFIAEASKRVRTVGIDISAVGISHCRKRAPNAYLELGSIENYDLYPTEPFDYIVSLGSLEHIVHIDKALDVIHRLLKRDGQFYFYCPNEEWKHFDQPNERTMNDTEWVGLFLKHGLNTYMTCRIRDNTAFWGRIV